MSRTLLQKSFHDGKSDVHIKGARHLKVCGGRLQVPSLDEPHDHSHVLIAERNPAALGANAFDDLAVVQGFHGTIAVRLNEASDAELGSPEVPNHGKHDLRQMVCPNDAEDRWSCSVGRFAIVAAPVLVAVMPQHPGVRHMSRGVMFLSEGLQMELGFFFRLDGKTIPKVL